jgi:hypothetical protein
MFNFTHYSYVTLDAKEYAKLTKAQQAQCEKGSKEGTYKLWLSEKLSVPTTLAELHAIKPSSTVDVTLGSDDEATEHKLDLAVYDYIVGRKLRSNQDMQSSVKGDSKEVIRNRTELWMTRDAKSMQELANQWKIRNAAGKPGIVAYNSWLDGLYEKNADAIDKQA